MGKGHKGSEKALRTNVECKRKEKSCGQMGRRGEKKKEGGRGFMEVVKVVSAG